MVAQLKEWSAQISLLEAKVANAGADAQIKHAEVLHELHIKQHEAAEKMKELGKASGETWEQVKETSDKVWAELKTGISNAQAKFL
ncbi:MAG: hypothetical protein HQL49_12470 [Gammaproteobacteria bacterium]|nr:hypothetical protein [Gammaproteobacteria bacterium]